MLTSHRTDRDARWDDLVLGLLLLVLGGLRVVLAVADHERFGVEATLATIVTGLGVLILLSTVTRRSP